jgi:hypothetical protein
MQVSQELIYFLSQFQCSISPSFLVYVCYLKVQENPGKYLHCYRFSGPFPFLYILFKRTQRSIDGGGAVFTWGIPALLGPIEINDPNGQFVGNTSLCRTKVSWYPSRGNGYRYRSHEVLCFISLRISDDGQSKKTKTKNKKPVTLSLIRHRQEYLGFMLYLN